MTALKSNLLTASFTVTDADLDDRSILSTCRILRGITEQTDAMIISATGALDYSRLQVKHYDLDIVGNAKRDDTVLIHAYIRSYENDELAIGLRAVRKRGRKEWPLVNGSIVVIVRKEAPVRYSLS